MKPKKKRTSEPTHKKSKNPNKSTIGQQPSAMVYTYMVFIALYMLMDLVPAGEVIVGSMRHRFYVDLLNMVVAGYILSNYSRLYAESVPTFFRQIIPILYGTFVLLSAISIAVAVNKTEGWVDVAMYLSNFVTFANIFILLYGTKDNIRIIAVLAAGILFCQVGIELYSFFENLGTKDVRALALDMKWNAGNKNIFSASIVVKLIFVLYACFRSRGAVQIFSYITLFISIIAIFILSARASYLSLFAIVLLVGIGQVVLYRKELATSKKPLYQSLALFGIFVVGFLISNHVLTKYATGGKVKVEDEVVAMDEESTSYIEGRLSSITDFDNRSTNIRFTLWSTALEKAKTSPLLGVGSGNYRIHSPYLMAEHYQYSQYVKYPHNDFVQIIVESGFLAGAIYLLIFVFAFALTIRIWVGEGYSQERKFVSILLLGGVIGFFIDSFFNFPLSKINMNIPFLLMLSLILMNYLSAKPKEVTVPSNTWARYGYIALIIVFLGAAYVNYEVFQSGKGQYIVRKDSGNMDYANPNVRLTFREVDALLSGRFPSIANNSQPIILQKARYLFAEKQYDKALEMMADVKEQSPYSLHFESFSKRLYAAVRNPDSTMYYSMVLLDKRPYSKEDYTIVFELAKQKKDVATIKKAYALHQPYSSNAEQDYMNYVLGLLQVGYDFTDDLAVLDEGLKQYPDNMLLKRITDHFVLLQEVKEGRRNISPDQLPGIVFGRNEQGQMTVMFE